MIIRQRRQTVTSFMLHRLMFPVYRAKYFNAIAPLPEDGYNGLVNWNISIRERLFPFFLFFSKCI